jgi:ribonuclease E
MFSPQVTLKSGGYIVINQTEALVSVDVNSGRSTREHNIEDTAHQTNLEAAEEISRQLRLRDLAGLIVIDFIDMEEKRNNRSVERKLKDALKNDRARIQVGRISHFGLLEMSRQRIRTGVLESTTSTCPTCHGTGHVRAPASVALHVLRSIEDQLLKGVTHNLTIRTRTPVALYILNQKRANLAELELRFGLAITVTADETITNGAHFAVERGEPVTPREALPPSVQPDSVAPVVEPEDEADVDVEDDVEDEHEERAGNVEAVDEVGEPREHRGRRDEGGDREDGQRRRRRRRRRRGGEGREDRGERHEGQPARHAEGDASEEQGQREPREPNGNRQPQQRAETELDENGNPRRRRRGRRGGRRGRGRNGKGRPQNGADSQPFHTEEGSFVEQSFAAPSYVPYAGLTGDATEIDTTPQPDEPVRRPQPDDLYRSNPIPEHREEPRPEPQFTRGETRPDESAPEPRPAPAAPEPEDDDPNRPKRGGWWQRRSFF